MARRTATKRESTIKKRERSASPPSSNEEEGIYTVERINQKRVDRNVSTNDQVKYQGPLSYVF